MIHYSDIKNRTAKRLCDFFMSNSVLVLFTLLAFNGKIGSDLLLILSL